MATWILGMSALFHDSAVALLRDGEVVAAQEERFTRKHVPSPPFAPRSGRSPSRRCPQPDHLVF